MSHPAHARPRRRWPRVLAGLLALLLVAVIAVVGWYLTRVNQALSAVPRVDFDTIAPEPANPTLPNVPGPTGSTGAKAPNAGTSTVSSGKSGAGSPGGVGGGAGSAGGAPSGGSTSGQSTSAGSTAAGAGAAQLPELKPEDDPFRPKNPAPKPTGPSKPGQPVATDPPGTGVRVSPAPPRPPVVPETQGVNFLLLGTDFADGGVGRSDSFMILHLTADRSKIYIISYPRDMYVPIPGYGNGKLNWAFHWGGTGLAKQVAEQMNGIGIDHTARVDFDAFIRLTDALGGVTIDNPYAFVGDGYAFPKGEITISGEQALAFVRQRYALPRGDLDRAANQRAVVKSIIAKAARPEVLANPARFDAVLSAASQAVTVDQNLTDARVRDLAFSLRLGSSEDIVLMQAPIAGLGQTSTGQSIDIVDWDRMAALKTALQNDQLAGYVARYGKR